MQPGDRLVCALVDPLEIATEFSEWPLHVTIVPWLRIDTPSAQLMLQLSAQLAHIHAFEARLNGMAKFGAGGKKTVHLIAEPNNFGTIEKRVRTYMHRHNAWLVDETTKQYRRPYRPHVTDQPDVVAREGMTFSVRELHIIEQRGEIKVVAGKIGLTK